MKTKKIIIVGIMIVILIIGIYFLWDKLIDNRIESVGVFIYSKFDGQSQSFEIRKNFDIPQDMNFEGSRECEIGFLEKNPTFNENTPEKETYYCTAFYTAFYKAGADKFSGMQRCSCFYKK